MIEAHALCVFVCLFVYFVMTVARCMQVAMDMLQTLVRASGAAASGGGASSSAAPVSDALINHAFAACVHCTLRADDQATMQNGGECVRAYVAVALEQVLQWHDGQGMCSGAPPSNPRFPPAHRALSSSPTCGGARFTLFIACQE